MLKNPDIHVSELAWSLGEGIAPEKAEGVCTVI